MKRNVYLTVLMLLIVASVTSHAAGQTTSVHLVKYAEDGSVMNETIVTYEWMEANLPEGLTVFMLPEGHRKKLRTGNWLENLNGKIRKRTSVVGLFPGTESVLRLVSAVLMETDERWLTGKRYLNMNVERNG